MPMLHDLDIKVNATKNLTSLEDHDNGPYDEFCPDSI